MTCIICRNDKSIDEFNREHVIPHGICGTITVNNVCVTCNSKMGASFDNELSDNIIIKSRMNQLGIPSVDGKIPNRYTGFNVYTRTGKKVHVYSDEFGNITKLLIDNDVKVQKTQNTLEVSILISESEKSKIGEIIRKILQRNNIGSTVESLHPRVSNEEIIEEKQLKLKCSIDSEKLELSMLKIAYEFACLWIGSGYLNDIVAKEISSKIYSYMNTGEFKKSWVGGISLDKELFPIFSIWNSETINHIVCMRNFKNTIVCSIRIFDKIYGTFTISNNSSHYLEFKEMFLTINPKTKKWRMSSFDDEKDRMYKEILRQ
jgi:hypothetical protein